MGKAIALGQYNALAGEPERINSDVHQLQAVTTDDVVRVYNTYIKDRPHIATSIVPKGELKLALTGSEQAKVVEEAIVQGAEAGNEESRQTADYERTPTSFDRTVEPPFGKPYVLPTPDVWRETLDNGTEVYGITSSETPLVYFSLVLDAGRDRGDVS